VEGLEILHSAYAAGRGAILLSFHGTPANWMTYGFLARRLGSPKIQTISHNIPLQKSSLDRIKKDSLPPATLAWLYAEIAYHGQQLLKQGGIVHIASDFGTTGAADPGIRQDSRRRPGVDRPAAAARSRSRSAHTTDRGARPAVRRIHGPYFPPSPGNPDLGSDQETLSPAVSLINRRQFLSGVRTFIRFICPPGRGEVHSSRMAHSQDIPCGRPPLGMLNGM
jgi:hypothetical protein